MIKALGRCENIRLFLSALLSQANYEMLFINYYASST